MVGLSVVELMSSLHRRCRIRHTCLQALWIVARVVIHMHTVNVNCSFMLIY